MNLLKPGSRVVLAAIVIVFIAVLLIVIRLGLSPVVKYIGSQWFEQQGASLTINDVSISIINSHLTLTGLSVVNDSGKRISLERLHVDWQWRPLKDNILVINELEISAFDLKSSIDSTGQLSVGGVVIPIVTKQTQYVTSNAESGTRNNSWQFYLQKLHVTDVRACIERFIKNDIRQNYYCMSLERFDHNGNVFVNLPVNSSDSSVILSINGISSLTDVIVVDQSLNKNLFSLADLNLNNISYESSSLVIDKIDIYDLKALERQYFDSELDNYLLQFDKIQLKPLRYSNNVLLEIDALSIKQPKMFFSYTNDGVSDINYWLQSSNKKYSDGSEEGEHPTDNSIEFKIGSVNLLSDGPVRYDDQRQGQELSFELSSIKLNVSNINTLDADSITSIDLQVKSSDHATVVLDLSFSHLEDAPDIIGNADVNGLDLRMFNKLAMKHIGHSVKSGQLDSVIDINVKKGIINSQLSMVLNQFNLTSLASQEAEKLNSDFGFPLNASLSLLRERDNKIHLDVPVTGNLDNPEFDLKEVIFKAGSHAITKAVLHYYTPFGLVFVAESLFDLATKLTFDPVLFKAGNDDLLNNSLLQLDMLAKLMLERPGIHITLCGVATEEDRLILFPGKNDKVHSDDSKSVEQSEGDLSETDLNKLLQLAESRSSKVKNYLVDINGELASRLVVCSASYEMSEQAAVLISL